MFLACRTITSPNLLRNSALAFSSSSLLDAKRFHRVADSTLESLCDYIEEKLDRSDQPENSDSDCNYSSGVLTIKLAVPGGGGGCISKPGDGSAAGGGTWVLNKQEPNREIWWSSPVSGPMRFGYLGENNLDADEDEEWSEGNLGKDWVAVKGDTKGSDNLSLRAVVEDEL
ncbi:hypothetical protein ScalyP_jg2105 [Parmales sp. scaly parma]|nr:hypothetical protein ScalyP_jg2105 [Parmales sp. scaly parma]